jgi:hypothetical protein
VAEVWRPGSFTKNFSWGPREAGLQQLYQMIRTGFDGILKDVPRDLFRERVRNSGRADYIALNFFLFNKIVDNIDFVVADELVFQALTSDHSKRFDKLALFAFNFSYVGRWIGAEPYQRRPALWAHHYISDRVAANYNWNVSQISADDIERFVSSDPRYKAKTSRKLSTNLNYLYSIGDLRQVASEQVERWWVDSMFLALDRLIEDREIDGVATVETEYSGLLSKSHFTALTGRPSLQKDLAINHLTELYSACGSRDRFSEDFVEQRTLALTDVAWLVANDQRPVAALHPTNPKIFKTIPRACAMLAVYAGFEVVYPDELENFDAAEFVRRHTKTALDNLQTHNIKPTMTAGELRKLTREK